MPSEKNSKIYGPVSSRRLGLSLGVDLVPFKVCDFDCIYCQLGETSEKTCEKAPYIPAGDILNELKRKLITIEKLDYITLSGSGEPTLNSELEEVIAGIKRMSEVPLAVLTNGSLLGDSEVAKACLEADLVMPSLDAGDEDTFQTINRPCLGITLQDIVKGLSSFRRRYDGDIWLEVFLLEGINSTESRVERIGELIERIEPDKVQLNTAVRPTVEPSCRPVGRERLGELLTLLGERAEIITDVLKKQSLSGVVSNRENVMSLIARRPCTIKDVASSLGVHEAEAAKILSELVKENLVRYESTGKDIYYRVR